MPLGSKTDLRVLIAMSNGQAAKGARAVFKEQGAELFQVVDGKQAALEKMRHSSYNLLLVEDSFSDLGGIDFVRYVRMSGNPTSVAPIIFAMKTPSKETVVEARDAGVNKMVIMPFTTASLLKNLADIMLNPRPFVQVTGYDGPCRRLKPYAARAIERRINQQGMMPLKKLQKVFRGI
ncbi:MAG: response regulator [Kordiimonadaceae bacterium]|nr:response regulator [Kordiimonadaceae bacterium]